MAVLSALSSHRGRVRRSAADRRRRRKEYAAAPYRTIQNAIFAAAAEPGTPTIAVCPGEYIEGGGGVGSNGLIIIDDVTSRARAPTWCDQAAQGAREHELIADSASPPNIRNATGAIVMINGADTQNGPTRPSRAC